MTVLGPTLRRAREAAGLSLSGMARRTGYSRGYLGNVETGYRRATPTVVRAYERAMGDDVNRRSLLLGTALVGALPVLPPGSDPDVAGDLVRDIAAERTGYLSTVVTSHGTDRTIARLVARDTAGIASLTRWSRKGSAILRANSAGILAKVGSPLLDNGVVTVFRSDEEAREIFQTAVAARVLALPWDEAGQFVGRTGPIEDPDTIAAFAHEIGNPYDCGARWCCAVFLARARAADPHSVDAALGRALRAERSREVLRTIAGTLAGVDPLRV
jgi:transcriptional regulator with XRE-family HTH domain